MIKRKTPAQTKGRRQHPESKGSAPREADPIPLTREPPPDNPHVDAWLKEISQSLEEVRKILEDVRARQLEAFVRTARNGDPAHPPSYRPGLLDFRQPRRDGDSYQNAAWPGSPNAGEK